MKKLLEQALVGKATLNAKPGRPCKDKTNEGARTGWKDPGWLAKEKEAKQEIDSEAESKLESLSDLDSEAGKQNCGELRQLYLA